MTTELTWLVYTALLSGSMWLPYVIGVNVTDFEGKVEQFVRPPDHRKMVPWVHRTFRAQQNLLEQLLPFAIVVLVGAISHVSTATTVVCSVIFFWLRVAHAIGFITGLTRFPLRPMIYFSGWIVLLVYAWQLLSHAA
jgi:uncharacterized MAPEG superfamily protein